MLVFKNPHDPQHFYLVQEDDHERLNLVYRCMWPSNELELLVMTGKTVDQCMQDPGPAFASEPDHKDFVMI